MTKMIIKGFKEINIELLSMLVYFLIGTYVNLTLYKVALVTAIAIT